MSNARYYRTIFIFMVLGGLIGMVTGAVFGWVGHEVGWWGVGLLLGLIYGTLSGFALADQA